MIMYPDYSNKHLVEVNCGFHFPQETIKWDSTYFGRYYEKIINLGFIERQERKGVHITFNANSTNREGLPASTSEQEDQVIFKNPHKGFAILLRKGGISFHCISNYPGWNSFKKNFIEPFFRLYLELGLGNGLRDCSVVYLNQFQKGKEESLSDYFTLVSSMDMRFGLDVMTSVQRIFDNQSSRLIARLNTQLLGDNQIVSLECGAVCIESELRLNSDWEKQADKTHDPIKSFFEVLIKDKLKVEL